MREIVEKWRGPKFWITLLLLLGASLAVNVRYGDMYMSFVYLVPITFAALRLSAFLTFAVSWVSCGLAVTVAGLNGRIDGITDVIWAVVVASLVAALVWLYMTPWIHIRNNKLVDTKGTPLEEQLAAQQEEIQQLREALNNLSRISEPYMSAINLQTKGLTEREQQVCSMLLEGRTNKEIAGELDVAEGTVKNDIRAIKLKTGSKSRAELFKLLSNTHHHEQQDER